MTDHPEKIVKLLKGNMIVMLTTVSESGALQSRPMTIQEQEDWTFRFIAQDENDVTRQADGKQVNLAVVDGGSYVSLSGTCRVERDVAKKRELWNRINEAYADDPEDPNNVILEVEAETGEYWDGGTKVGQVIGIVKAAITKDAPEGDHGTTQL